MGRTYDTSSLKEIGQQCSNRLPLASTVQAMFTYMVQRDADVQARFEGAIFEIAKAEEEATKHDERLSAIEGQIKDVQARSLSTDIEQRLATSKVRTVALACRQNEQFTRLGEYGRRLTELENGQASTTATQTMIVTAQKDNKAHLSTISSELDVAKSQITNLNTSTKRTNEEMKQLQADLQASKDKAKDLKTALDSADKDIQLLFDERDALMDLLSRANERIDTLETESDAREAVWSERLEKQEVQSDQPFEKLEGLVRALTLQKTSPTLTSVVEADRSRSPSVHFCPVTTKNGENVDLVVPKGKGFVSSGKEDIKAFTPGKPWGS